MLISSTGLNRLVLFAMVLTTALIAFAKTPATTPATRRAPDYADGLAARFQPTRSVVYKKVGDRELRLFVFEPANHKPADRRACLVSIHGGGWAALSPVRNYPFAAHAAETGMLGISVEYRLAKNGVTVYDCVRDARSAVRYVRAHANELGIDPQKIVAQGGSAGGHLAAGTALFDEYDDPADDKTVSCVPNALILHFPVIDTSSNGYGRARLGEKWKDVSPLHRVRAGVPPTLLFHGTGDTVTPYAGAKAFTDAMIKAGNRCELVTHEGGQHGYLMRDAALFKEAQKKADEFLAGLGYIPAGK